VTPKEMDRLTIVARKILEKELLGQEFVELGAEREALTGDDRQGIFALELTRLASINGAIWQRESAIRATLDLTLAGRLGKEIAILNDLRAQFLREEKVY
jgi:hypothetical protein